MYHFVVLQNGTSRKSGAYTSECIQLQMFREQLSSNVVSEEMTSATSGYSTSENETIMTETDMLMKIKEKESVQMERNISIARKLILRATSEQGLKGLWDFYKVSEGNLEVENDDLRSMYYMFVDTCVSNMMPKKYWKENHMTKKLSEFLTISNEAFAMLILENIAPVLVSHCRLRNGEIIKTGTTRYTKKDKDESGKMKGWRMTSIKRYNSLIEDVIMRRGIKALKEKLELDLRKRYVSKVSEEENLESNLETENNNTKSRKRKMVRGYDMSLGRMPNLSKEELNIPEKYKELGFELSTTQVVDI